MGVEVPITVHDSEYIPKPQQLSKFLMSSGTKGPILHFPGPKHKPYRQHGIVWIHRFMLTHPQSSPAVMEAKPKWVRSDLSRCPNWMHGQTAPFDL